MNCAGKKYSHSSAHAPIISRVFQVPWFPRFKQKTSNPEANPPNQTQHRAKPDFPTPNSSLPPVRTEPRFYSVDDDDDDAYWRLSFRDEKTEGRRSITGGTSLRYDSDYEFQIPVSSFTSFGSKEIDEKQYKEHIMHKHDAWRRKKRNGEEKFTTPRKREHSRKMNSSKPVERDIFPVEPEYTVDMKQGFRYSPEFNSANQQNVTSADEEDYTFGRVSISEFQDLENDKLKRSRCRKIKRKNRANFRSPKREFRIRALEEMKKERTRLKKKETMELVVEGRTIYDSFAEVMTSFNPQQDFRDSMVEMIIEKDITRPDELEELLACYLTLNCDEYHDLIINVFQQVWFELSGSVY